AHAVGVDAAVVVVVGVLDPAGERARGRHARAGRVRGGPEAVRGGGALPTGVHDDVGVAGGGPGEAGVGETASAAVADVLDDGGQLLVRAPGGPQVPALDAVAAEAGEGEVVGLDDAEV